MIDENATAIREYANRLEDDAVSSASIAVYTKFLQDLFEKVIPNKSYKDATMDDIHKFYTWKKKQNQLRSKQTAGKGGGSGVGRCAADGYRPQYLNLMRTSLHRFFKILGKGDLAINIKRIKKGGKWMPPVFDLNKINPIFDIETAELVYKEMGSTNKVLPLRDSLLVGFLYATGARISEATKARAKDILFDRKVPMIKIRGKGGKIRIIPLSSKWIKEWKEYKKVRCSGSDFLFVSNSGARLSVSSTKIFVRRVLAVANIEGIKSPHMLRHCYATYHNNIGTNLKKIQDSLGHSSLEVTSRYIQASGKQLEDVVSPYDRLEDKKKKAKRDQEQD